MLQSLLNSLPGLAHVILTTALGGRHFYYPLFTEVKVNNFSRACNCNHSKDTSLEIWPDGDLESKSTANFPPFVGSKSSSACVPTSPRSWNGRSLRPRVAREDIGHIK